MPRSSPSNLADADRFSLYQENTSNIIAELEAGRLPWVQPWGTSAVQASLTMPKNATMTERHHSGVNVLIPWGAVVQHGLASQSWLTFRQALLLDGHDRRGERGTTVMFASPRMPSAIVHASRVTRPAPSRSWSGSLPSTGTSAKACRRRCPR